MNEDELLVNLKNLLKGKIVFVGIGNPLRGDDGFGSEVIEKLRHLSHLRAFRPSPSFLDVGEVPENYLQKITAQRPDVIILFDAVQFGAASGTIKLVQPDEIGEHSLSTHSISLRLTIRYLQNETGARVFVLGVQPQTMEFGQGISEPVRNSLKKVVKLFGKI